MMSTKRKFDALSEQLGPHSSPSTPIKDHQTEPQPETMFRSVTPSASPSMFKPPSATTPGSTANPFPLPTPVTDSAKRRRLGLNDATIISVPSSATKLSGISLRKWGPTINSPRSISTLPKVTTTVTNITAPMMAAKYCPSDRDELIKRLSSFQEISDWAPKPDQVNEIEWAKRGWVCCGKERVSCTLCSKELVLKLNAKEVDGKEVLVLIPSEIETALVEKYRELIVSSHQDNCLWRQAGCEDSLLRISFSDSARNFQALRTRYDELCARADALPYDFDLKLPEEFDLNDVLAQLPKDFFTNSAPVPKTYNPVVPNGVALTMAIMGWQGLTNPRIGTIPNSASCHTCLRRLGLWMFKAKEIGNDGTIKTPAAMDHLDPAREHRFFCPWKNPDAQKLPTARSKPGSDIPAWQALLQSIRNEAYVRERLAEKPKSRMQRMRSKSELLLTHSKKYNNNNNNDTDPSTPNAAGSPALGEILGNEDRDREGTREAKDKERWAKLRRVKSLFDTKKKKGSSRPGTAMATATSRPGTATASMTGKKSGKEKK